MKESVLREKSYAFALRIVKLYQHLAKEQREFVLSKQVLRSGTSIGANIEEAGRLNRSPISSRSCRSRKKNHLRLITGLDYCGIVTY